MTPEQRREYNREYQRQWRKIPANREYYAEYAKRNGPQKRLERKLSVLSAYGGAFCACCGEAELAFLTIDHIDGGGNEHRRQMRPGATAHSSGGATMYRWLIKEGFPPGYQVLCFNCNCGRRINGGVCPHEQAVLSLVRESA